MMNLGSLVRANRVAGHILTFLVGQVFMLPLTAQVTRAASALRVSENGRYLVRANGKPFFWLGNTAWLQALRYRWRQYVESAAL